MLGATVFAHLQGQQIIRLNRIENSVQLRLFGRQQEELSPEAFCRFYIGVLAGS